MPTPKKETPKICQPGAKGSSCGCPSPKGASEKAMYTELSTKSKAHKQTKSRVLVQCDCGFGNSLYIRGEGISTLSWDEGAPMINRGPSEWVWETDRPFSVAKFKVLINDATYEQGENHAVGYGEETTVSPAF